MSELLPWGSNLPAMRVNRELRKIQQRAKEAENVARHETTMEARVAGLQVEGRAAVTIQAEMRLAELNMVRHQLDSGDPMHQAQAAMLQQAFVLGAQQTIVNMYNPFR